MGQISFGAFPRSGNYFINWSMKNGLVNTDYQVFAHNAHNLLNAPNRFTVIRNPLDTISSAIVHFESKNPDKVNRFTEWYVDYYSQCLIKKCLFVSFDNLISKPKETFIRLADRLGVKKHRFNELDYSLGNTNATKPAQREQVSDLKKEVIYSNYFSKAVEVYEKSPFN